MVRQAINKVEWSQCRARSITEKGYQITRLWSEGDRVELDFPMEIKRIYAHPNVRMNAGKIAIARGPMIYCLEESDNGSVLTDIALPRKLR